MMKHNIFNSFVFAFALAMAPAVGSAQNLNPVVEISKSYVGKLSETRKPIEAMAVPDSLMRFDLDFDYSVFDNPYRGAYIFSPYVVDIKPQKVLPWNRQFYFKVGAGYMFRPEMDLFWSPKTGDKFKMNVYATGDGFMGNYKNITTLHHAADGGPVLGYEMPKTHGGYDFGIRSGVNGYWDWKKGRLSFDVAYSGLHNSDSLVSASYNAMEMMLRLQSNKHQRPNFFYDARFKMRFGADQVLLDQEKVKGLLPSPSVSMASSNPVPAVWVDDYTTHFMDIILDGTLGPKFNSASGFLIDFDFGVHRIGLTGATAMGSFSATPRYTFEKDRLKISAGVRMGTVFVNDMVVAEPVPNEYGSYLGATNALGLGKSQHFYPAIRLDYEAIKDYMNIYFKVDGGDQVNDYTSLKQRNHFFNLTSAAGLGAPIDNSITKFDVSFGLRGNIAKRFDYNVYGGYRSVRNGLVDLVGETNGTYFAPIPMVASVGYQNFDWGYAHADFVLDYRNVLIDGFFQYNHTDLFKNQKAGFEPARFMGQGRVRYNWKNRLHVGIEAEGASARRGYIVDMASENGKQWEGRIPYFLDLGLSAEFFFNRKMSIWLKGDNLLNQTIQRTPLYPEAGIGFTAGICINL